ncbi:hypothetical protein CerSpe_181610 [Prunus speciosa]
MSTGTGLSNHALAMPRLGGHDQTSKNNTTCQFQMPLHYPRYQKRDYETMPEWKLDCLLKQYGLPVIGDVNQKRKFAMGAFLWPSQYE